MWLLACRPPAHPTQSELADLTAGQHLAGFEVNHLYVDDGDRPLGGSFTHAHTGFELRLLRMRTVPSGYLWVDTVPAGDRGEPHTQEHLLLGKGNRGRAVATLEDMSLVSSSAFTSQLRTVYHFHTTASPGVFFDVLDARLGALLFPDYSDEEIRREVHHYGVRETSEGLALEEKGTVYNEMDSSAQRPGFGLWRLVARDLYGSDHPMARSSGGLPEAIRTMTPEHIRSFHAATYQLPNMGMIAVIPPEQPVSEALQRLDGILRAHQPEPTPPDTTFPNEDTLPPPRPTDDRTVRDVTFPSGDAAAPGSVLLSWPPTRDLTAREHTFASILLDALAGNDSSNLYKAIVDSSSRERDTGARSVWVSVSQDPGNPIHFGVSGIPGSQLDDETVRWLVDRIRQELRDVAALPPGDPALADLVQRMQDQTVSSRRWIRRSISTPPGFGFRSSGTGWFSRLREVDEEPGFRRSLTLASHFDHVDAELGKGTNPFAEHLARLGLLDEEPLVYANRPDPEKLAALGADRKARLEAETQALQGRFDTDDAQDALRRFQERYDAETTALEAAEAAIEARFVDDPPMVRDPTLDYAVGEIGGVPAVRGRFDAMTGADVRLYLSMSGLDEAQQQWLAVLTRLMTRSGVILDGEPVSHVEVRSRLQREVLTASATIVTNVGRGPERMELALLASGTTAEETDAAIRWARTFLDAPDWRPENLPRMRDLLESSLSGLQQRMLGREESWVRNPKSALTWGQHPAQLRAWSFLTQAHDVLRLFWRLSDPPAPATLERVRALADVVDELDRDALRSRFRDLGQDDEALATLGGHLERSLADIPDESRAQDLRYLVARLAADWEEPPTRALAELDSIRAAIRARGGARMVVTAGALLDGIDDRVQPLLELLEDGEAPPAPTPSSHVVRDRIADRGGDAGAAHLGLFDPNRRSGVHLHRGSGSWVGNPDDDSVLDYLAMGTWGGGGAHGLFMSTWGAGLAYSNGASSNLELGSTSYYAERCPSLGQTLDFVIGEIEGAKVTPAIAEYAIAGAFSSRAASAYESRTASMASDLIDGVPPEMVRAFREAVLAQRGRPDLAEVLQERLPRVYGRTIPALAPEWEGLSLVIGDDDQLDDWAAWLESRNAGPLQRIHPRDFWIVTPP